MPPPLKKSAFKSSALAENYELFARFFNQSLANFSYQQDSVCKWENQAQFESIQKDKKQITLQPLQLSKHDLAFAKVFYQWDKKFILAILPDKTLLVFDQHAVDERIQLESLLNQVCFESIPLFTNQTPIDLQLNHRQKQTFFSHSATLKKWGIELDAMGNLTSFPLVFKDRILPNPLEFKEIIYNYILYLEKGGISTLIPKGYLELLHSIACRSAIKFGEKLSLEQSKRLIQQLSLCKVFFRKLHD